MARDPRVGDAIDEQSRQAALVLELQRLQDQATATLLAGDAMARTNPAVTQALDQVARMSPAEQRRYAGGGVAAQQVPTGPAAQPMTAEGYRVPGTTGPEGIVDRGRFQAGTQALRQRQLDPYQLQGLENLEREVALWRGMDEGGNVRPVAQRSVVGADLPLPSEQAQLGAWAAEEAANKQAAIARDQQAREASYGIDELIRRNRGRGLAI